MSEQPVPPADRQPAPRRPFAGPDAPLPSDALLRLHGAKALDPGSVALRKNQVVRPTAYVADRLIVPADNADEVIGWLNRNNETAQIEVVVDEDPDRPQSRRAAVALRVQPTDDNVAVPDAWTVLQNARGKEDSPRLMRGVGLDHVLLAHQEPGAGKSIGATPHDEPHDPTGTSVAGEASWTGYEGPYPVQLVLDRPRRHDPACHRPVVAVVDTGCGTHPWLTDGVDRDLSAYNGGPSPEEGGELTQPMDGARPRAAGHGTFISGLIRQLCPDADILAVGLLQADGVATEFELVDTLSRIRDLAKEYIASAGKSGHRVDVVSLSCGFYHEEADDAAIDATLRNVLHDLGRLGVAVVSSAGNDATIRPMYPAGFAPYPGGPVPAPEHDAVPLVSVGALNPDGTVALFSNSGPWVRDWELGAALISTMPKLDYGRNPATSTVDPVRGGRQCVDPDRYTGYNGSGGFGQWSGTSFASPVLAGRLARALMKHVAHTGGDCGEGCMTSVENGWAAVLECVPDITRP